MPLHPVPGFDGPDPSLPGVVLSRAHLVSRHRSTDGGVQPLEFDPCIGGRERPVGAGLPLVAVPLPRLHRNARAACSGSGPDPLATAAHNAVAWRLGDGVFVVSPHHVQIGLIRGELARRRAWTAPPFVDTVDKMQGQEAEAVVVSYGVSDTEFALREAEFIYRLNRLNVAVTRGKSKCVVCLPAPLLAGTPEVLDIPEAERGLAYMRRLAAGVEAGGETKEFDLGDGVTARVMRTGRHWST